MIKLQKNHNHKFLKLSSLPDAIIQEVITYKIEPEFLIELSMISSKSIDI